MSAAPWPTSGPRRLRQGSACKRSQGKRRLVEAASVAHLLPAVRIEAVIAAPGGFRYRNKMEFSFGARRWIDKATEGASDGVALGLHAANVYSKVVDVASCAIQSPAADAILQAAREVAVASGLSFWDARTHTGLLRHLVIRAAHGTGEILVGIVTSTDAREAVDALAAELRARDLGITTIVHGVNERPADTAIADRERVVSGPGRIRERLGDLVFRLSAGSFFPDGRAGRSSS
jgi:23S rRNA (uracil1939-C5)-methyltransferase